MRQPRSLMVAFAKQPECRVAFSAQSGYHFLLKYVHLRKAVLCMDQHLVPVRREIADMAGELFGIVSIPFEQTSELQRQILATFAFGMIFAIGQIRRLSPADVHALAICCLMDVFKYADHQAVAFSTDLIAHASSKEPNNTHKAIIHHGIDGHYQWEQRQVEELRSNIARIFEALRA